MTADFLRGIMVSAAALIMGFSVSSTYLLLRGKKLGRAYTIPGWVNFIWLIGYNVLLFSVIVGRWQAIGTGLTIASVIASVGLTLNVIAVLAYSWYIKEGPTVKP
jgi:hypothetical protein